MEESSLTLSDFNSVCRTCLGREKLAPIFESLVEDIKVVDLLDYGGIIEVKEGDYLPDNICEDCLKLLYQIYMFKKQCLSNETAFKFLLEQVPSNEVPTLIEEPVSESEGEDNLDIMKKPAERRSYTVQTRLKPPPYLCNKCDETFDTQEAIQEHRKREHHIKSTYNQCTYCDKKFRSVKLAEHIRSHTKEKPFECNICHKRFSVAGNLNRHKMTHTGERPHVCTICGKGFIQAHTLRCHEKVHQEGWNISKGRHERYNCEKCGRSFKSIARFKSHQAHHCAFDVPKTSRKARELNKEAPREHVCDICQRGCKNKYQLRAHRLIHGDRHFLCSECGKGFLTRAALESHLRIHTGEKPYTCAVCHKSFAHVSTFETHMLTHTGVRPHSCPICPKTFTQLTHLTYHRRTHSGEKPYVCTYCNKAFALKGNLTVHVRTHTGETPYICPVCNKGFYDSSSLRKHRRTHHITTQDEREEVTNEIYVMEVCD